MKLGFKELILLGGSVLIDSLQGFVFFNVAMCGAGSIIGAPTGVGVILALICAVGALGFAALGVLFSIAYGAFAFAITGKKLYVAAGALETVPVLSTLPIFTATSLYYIAKGGK